MNLRDIIGDSGSNVALKQASETIDMLTRTAGGLASKLMKSAFNSSSSSATTTESTSSGGPSKDIISCCIGDLRAVLSSKPGNLSLQGITSGFLSGNIPGVSKTNLEAAKIQWELDGERQIKDCLLLFFAYLFADIDEAVNMSFLMKQKASDSGVGKNKGGSHTAQFISQAFDFNSLLQRRAATESRAILDFLSDFRNSEMFVQFCDNKLMRILTADKSSSRPPAAHETVGMGDNLFEALSEELRGKRPSIPLVKQTIATLRAYQDQVNASQDALESGSRLKSTLLHILTVQLTGGSIGDNAARRAPGDESTADSPIVRLSGKGASDSPWDQAITTICADTYQSDAVPKIMKTITLRLVCCKAAGNKGSAGLAGKRALILLRSLLIDGCESVLAFALDLVPVLRGIIRLLVGRKQEDEARNASSSAQPFEMLSLSTNYSSDIVPFARVVLRLIVDHNLLGLQRQFSFQARSGVFPHKTSSTRNELWSTFARDKYTLPSFVACHNRFRPPAECNFAPEVFAYNLTKTKPTKQSEEDRIDDNEMDIDDIVLPVSGASDKRAPQALRRPSQNLISFESPVASNSAASSVVERSPDLLTFHPEVAPSVRSALKKPADGDLIEFSEEMKFRMINKDTGEVLDIRYDIDKTVPKNGKAASPHLLPPPPKVGGGPRAATKTNGAVIPTGAVIQNGANSKAAAPSFDAFGSHSQPAFVPSSPAAFAPSFAHSSPAFPTNFDFPPTVAPPSQPLARANQPFGPGPSDFSFDPAPSFNAPFIPSVPGPSSNTMVRPSYSHDSELILIYTYSSVVSCIGCCLRSKCCVV